VHGQVLELRKRRLPNVPSGTIKVVRGTPQLHLGRKQQPIRA
jgi:hypothetical protein